jgi:hypothetical protein
MSKTKDLGLNMGKLKEITFRGSYTEIGEKLIIIVPKNYLSEKKRMSKPVDAVV